MSDVARDTTEGKKNPDTNTFSNALMRYEQLLKITESTADPPNSTLMMEVLLARDALQTLLESNQYQTTSQDIKHPQMGQDVLSLATLDDRLRAMSLTIADNIDLVTFRGMFNHPDTYWWWAFEVETQTDAWDRFDWVWNALTAGAVALAASFMYNIYTAFATGDADVATALSTIIQVAGLAIVGGGALTANGHAKVQQILTNLNIPTRFQAEATFGIALILLAAVIYTNETIDDRFFLHGQREYENGYLNYAKLAYTQALEVNPRHIDVHDSLGQVYESEGDLNNAFNQYSIGADLGYVSSLTNLGRVAINRQARGSDESHIVLAEAYLLMALQRAETQDNISADQRYQVYRNLGWSLIAQERYKDALVPLETAMQWKDELADNTEEGGMNNCFLAYAYEQAGDTDKGDDYWKRCIQYGRPDYIHEYGWLIDIGRSDIAYCVNTQAIVGGYEGVHTPELQEQCTALLEK
ncbi:MAG: hypothetical protein AAF639_42800 [Chloroflexota bacterium]